jgi:hypothetical protein
MKFKRFMPMFDADGGTGTGAGVGGADGTIGNNNGVGDSKGADDSTKGDKQGTNTDLERLLQAKLDKAMAEERKKSANLQKELEKMKKEKMTADELKKYDDEKRANELAERERVIAEKENRYYAVGAIKKAGLDDGSDTAMKIVDLVLGANSEEIDTKVAALNELVNKLVDGKVNEKFKSAGRTPGGSNSTDNEHKKDTDIAEKLGKARAEQLKKSNEILKYYTN